MADKYIYDNAGQYSEKAGVTTSAGAGDAGKIPALDSTGKLDASMMPVGTDIEAETIVASEALSAGDFVNIFNSAGTLKCRKADATAVGKEANGFVLAGVALGGNATVYRQGLNTQRTGLTIGDVYFLHTTAGSITNVAPSTAGNIVQRIGRASSATAIHFEEEPTLVKA